MEQTNVETYLCTETVAPTRPVLRSDGALYVALLLAVLGIIVCGNALSALWEAPRILIQLVLYAILVGIGCAVYRYCLTSFRYLLTDRMLTVSRVIGKKVKPDEGVHLSDIVSIRAYAPGEAGKKPRDLCAGGRKDRLVLNVRAGGRQYGLLIAPSEGFREKLITQWKKERK